MKFSSDSQGKSYLSFEDNDEDLFKKESAQIGNKFDDFEILQVLSENNKQGYSFVAKVLSRTNNKIYSMKKVELNKNKSFNSNNISSLLAKLITINHPHILKYYTYFQEGNNLYLIMEYMDNADIIGYIQAYQIFNKPLPEFEIWNILLQCLSALNYLSELNLGNIGIKLTNIFITNMYNIKIGVFRDLIVNDKLIDNKEEINLLRKYLYVMMKSLSFEIKELDALSFLDNITINDFSNDVYSKVLIDIMNNKFKGNIQDLYNLIKEEYAKKYTKNSSIIAIVKCLSSDKYFTNKLMEGRKEIESNKEKYYMTNWFLKAIDALNGKEESNMKFFTEEFKRALALTYIKLDGNEEIEPILVLAFLLNKIHKEMNKIDKEQISEDAYNKYKKSTLINKNYVFDGEEKDRTNKGQMLQEFVNYFNATMQSPISQRFISFMKHVKCCQKCNTNYYSFSNFLYIVFDLTKLNNIQSFDLINDGFQVGYNTAKNLNDNNNGNDKIRCERCQSEDIIQFNRYYMINNQLIIYFYRGRKYENRLPINFSENINVKNFIEPNINSAQDFYLVGSVNRKIESDEFISYNRDPNDENKWKSNNNFNVLQQNQMNGNEQIIMLFYNSKRNFGQDN